jgi:hypothetical protein
MNAFVVINSISQDLSLGGAFDAEMKNKNWSVLENVPNMYVKKFDVAIEEVIKKVVDADIDAAALEAEWEGLDYAVIITSSVYSVTKTK